MNIYDTREGVRLRMNQQGHRALESMGTVCRRACLGHRSRRLQRRRRRVELTFPHDHARSCAYRWNEDGIAGICDRHQYLCFALAFWNGKDPYLKERMFGVSGHEGNHGEDVKEYYFYLDNTPTHSYMKYVYKYPHAEYPYEHLVQENQRRSRHDPEFELVDTGIFHEDRYFDIVIEYAKHEPEDLLIRVNITNRGSGSGADPRVADAVVSQHLGLGTRSAAAEYRRGGGYQGPRESHADDGREALRAGRVHSVRSGGGRAAVHRKRNQLPASVQRAGADAVCEGCVSRIRRARQSGGGELGGAGHQGGGVLFAARLAAGKRSRSICDWRRSSTITRSSIRSPILMRFITQRQEEADEFYNVVLGDRLSADAKLIARQAFAGMLWSKQYYHFVVTDWLDGDPAEPAPPPVRRERGITSGGICSRAT